MIVKINLYLFKTSERKLFRNSQASASLRASRRLPTSATFSMKPGSRFRRMRHLAAASRTSCWHCQTFDSAVLWCTTSLTAPDINRECQRTISCSRCWTAMFYGCPICKPQMWSWGTWTDGNWSSEDLLVEIELWFPFGRFVTCSGVSKGCCQEN